MLKNRLRIAVVVSAFPALSETFILNRITGLIERGHSVEIFASSSRDRDTAIHSDVLRYNLLDHTHYESEIESSLLKEIVRKIDAVYFLLRKANISSIFRCRPGKVQIRQLTRFKKAGRFDVIQAFFGTNGNLAVLARDLKIIDGPVAVSFHGFDLSQKIKEDPKIYQSLFEKADLFLPVCEYYKKRLIRLGCPTPKIKVHPSAIDIKQFRPASKKRSVSRLNIISIGRLVEKKGFKYGIEAVANFIRENPGQQIKYAIIGDGPLRGKLQNLIRNLDMANQIKIYGSHNQNKILPEIQKSDILICPSVISTDGDEDTVPNVLKEAMACELPVIASRHGGIPELVQDQVNGFLIEEKDVTALKNKIEVLADSAELRKKLGEEGRRYVKKNYDIDFHNDIISSKYINLASNYSKK